MDDRIRVYHQENRGLIASLNRGCQLARGKYIARMDQDDLSLPERLAKQVAFLDVHPEIGILGTACRLIDANGEDLGLRQWPINDLEIRWVSLLASPFGHPTVIMRRNILVENRLKYDEAFKAAEDYDLWPRILNYTCGGNLSEPLMRYRVHGDSATSRYREVQLKNHDSIALRTIHEQLPNFDIAPEQVSQLRGLFVGGGEFIPDLDARRVALAETYLDMLDAFTSRHCGDPRLTPMQHHEAWRVVAALAFHPHFQRGWTHIARRLMTMHPCLPWFLLGHFSKAFSRRLRRCVLVSIQHTLLRFTRRS